MHKDIFFNIESTPYNYSYCKDNNLWYSDQYDIIPKPLKKPKKIKNFSIRDDLGTINNSSAKEDTYFFDFLSINFSLDKNIKFEALSIAKADNKYIYPKNTTTIDFYYIDDLEKLLFDLKLYDNVIKFIPIHNNPLKFFIWQEKNDKIQLVIQKYYSHLKSGKAIYYPYSNFDYVYNVLIDRQNFINELERIITKYKPILEKSINTIEKINHIEFVKPYKNKYLENYMNYLAYTLKRQINSDELNNI